MTDPWHDAKVPPPPTILNLYPLSENKTLPLSVSHSDNRVSMELRNKLLKVAYQVKIKVYKE